MGGPMDGKNNSSAQPEPEPEPAGEAASVPAVKLRLVRLNADDQPPEAKPKTKGVEKPVDAHVDAPWRAFKEEPGQRATSVASTSSWRSNSPQMLAHMQQVRGLHGILGEIERRLAQDHRVPELIADAESKLTRTPASKTDGRHGAHITGEVGPAKEYVLAEVKADIKRLQQKRRQFVQCDMVAEKDTLLSQLKAHRDLLQNLWAYVDTGGKKLTPQGEQVEARRWYAGVEGERQRRPVTGMQSALGKRKSTSKSFSTLVPKEQPGVMTPDDPHVTGIVNPGAMGSTQKSRTRMLPDLSSGSLGDLAMATLTQTQDYGGMRRPMQLEKQEFLPPLQPSFDRSLARSRRSPYRMRKKGAHKQMSEVSSKYSVGIGAWQAPEKGWARGQKSQVLS